MTNQCKPYEPPALETTDCAELVRAIDVAEREEYDENRWDALQPYLKKIQAVLTLAPTGLGVIQELDKAWGIDNLVDINVEQPADYLLVLGHLVDLARRTVELERKLADAKKLIGSTGGLLVYAGRGYEAFHRGWSAEGCERQKRAWHAEFAALFEVGS